MKVTISKRIRTSWRSSIGTTTLQSIATLLIITLSGLLFLPLSSVAAPPPPGQVSNANRIRPWSANSWYWQYLGEPVLLLGGDQSNNWFATSGWQAHLDAIAAAGGNYVRHTMKLTASGGYPFKQLANGKYDLAQWSDDYWQRFTNHLQWTYERGFIMHIEVWDRFDYSRDPWLPNPYNPTNNVNYTYAASGFDPEYPAHPGQNQQPFFYTTPAQNNNTVVLPYQQAFVEKMLSYSLSYPHVIYCMDNETSGAEAWSTYWADFIKQRAQTAGRDVFLTEMWDNHDLQHAQHKRTFDNPQRYAFVDVSQNTHNRGANAQTGWDKFQWARTYLSGQPRPMNTVKVYGADGGPHGNTRDGIEGWWRHLIGGGASVRFHRPPTGLGFSSMGEASIRAARKLESLVKLWDLTPNSQHSLLANRANNEAYLAANPGTAYALYFTNGGSVDLDLRNLSGSFDLQWINIQTGNWGTSGTLNGGAWRVINAPSSGHWVAAITRPVTSPPSAPSGLTATAVSSSQINLSWNDNSNNETQFRLERKVGSGSFSFLTNKGANVTTHSDTGLQPGTTYTYRVRAENAAGNSAWSNEAGATTQSSGGLVSNLSVASGKAYVVVPSLANGELVYIDRTFTWSNVGAYAGRTFIRTANDDKSRTETSFLSFDVSQAVTVYVAYDVRATSLPNWLASWTDTADILGTTDVDRRVYSKPFSAGTVTLGGNAATGMAGAGSMYSVIIASSGGAFQESGGEVVMEGENFHALDGRTDPNSVNWQVATAVSGAVGGQYVETPGPQGTNGEWSNACEASYNVNFTTTGTYNVWVRRYAVDGAQNSISAGLNGVQTTGVDNTSDYNAWVWKNLATVSVTSAGVHTFQLRRREAGYKVDRIVLRTSSATPSGNGPAESPQSGGGGDITNGIVGYWKLNETSGTTASDSSGNGLHGTLFNGPVWSGGTLAFDGVNDYVDVGNPSQLQFTGAMTLSAWVRVNSFNNGRIIAKQGGSTNRGWTLNVESGGYAAFGIANSGNTVFKADSAPLATNTWYHLVGVYEPGVAVRIYVNAGAPISNTTSIPASQRNSTLNVNIGRRPDAVSDTHFNGNIDDVRAYNRVLSASEITTLFNNGAQ